MNKKNQVKASIKLTANETKNKWFNFHRIFEFINNFYNWQAPLVALIMVMYGEAIDNRMTSVKFMQFMNRNVHSIQFFQTVVNTILYFNCYLWLKG